MDNSVIARSGWLFRKVSANEWRKSWIELYRDGYLKYYESDYSPNPEDVIYMPTECISIKTGLQVEGNPRPPDGHSSQCLFSVSAAGNKTWVFCGDSLDDMRAWQLALEQARLLIVRSHYSSNHPLMMHSQRLPGSTHLDNHLSSHRRISPYTRTPHSYHPLNLANPFFSTPGDTPLTYITSLRPPHTAGLNTSHIPTSGSRLPAFYPSFPMDPTPGSTTYPLYPPTTLSSLQARHPLISGAFQPPYPRPDARDLNIGVLAGTASSPNAGPGVGPMVWSPFIWW